MSSLAARAKLHAERATPWDRQPPRNSLTPSLNCSLSQRNLRLPGTYQSALFEAGIPLTAFFVKDIQQEFERMEELGVKSRTKPTNMGIVTIAVFEDTCGNLIRIVQK